MQLTYAGSTAQLQDLLSQSHVDISTRGGMWWLAPASADTATDNDAGDTLNNGAPGGAPGEQGNMGTKPGAGLQ